MPKFVVLWTDWVVFALVAALVGYAFYVRRDANLRASWQRVFRNGPAMGSSIVLLLGLAVTVVDSVHMRLRLDAVPGSSQVVHDTRTVSALDLLLSDLVASRESTYSVPLAYEGFTRESVVVGGEVRRVNPRLLHGGAHLKDPGREWAGDVTRRVIVGVVAGLAFTALCGVLLAAGVARTQRVAWREAAARIMHGETVLPWRLALLTLGAISLVAGPMAMLAGAYHVLGTDRTGNDVLYQSLKSIRTAFVIGTLSTVATLPLAVGLGVMAGYFRGWVDEVIQYVYTMLSSVPNVLLIAACVLMVQVFLDKNPDLFETGAERADLKLFILCVILGLTGWAGLCRLVRAETLKLRELDYVQAATAFGVGPWRIMARHIFPNVMHLVLITTVLDFCALILYEAVLSYVGVGVDPSMNSFGGMINLARSEMSRDPLVWWSFASAFGFMVSLVLAANLFADGVQEAFDPRARVFRPRLSTRRRRATGSQA
jgi:peptide/nickel transport system permease protein